MKKRKSSWEGLGDEVFSRLSNALNSLSFIAFFLVGIILIGGVGIWLPYLANKSETATLLESQNLFTYTVAILGTLSIEGFFSKNKKANLAALGLIIGAVALLLTLIGYWIDRTGFSWYVTVGSILTLIIFLFSNVNDERFDDHDEIKTSTPTGYPDADVQNIVDKK
ncbi:hypothetical protein H5125_02675 [Shewanella sp. SR44-4]|uniref:hypothetical protein n=1 Tax=Shewanella sp. SR44-4 TaxID=2760935 RepID=UPI001601CC8D|nr:hypothetical protein [Shewanella sp. SR44-4]MBB1361062.1 hypothetical protein [Shewanella sp. SR44-4]